MVKTKSISNTITVVRLILIQMNIEDALRRTSDISDSSLKAIKRGLENQWIGKVIIYALDKNEKSAGQLVLKIDWKKHGTFLGRGEVEVQIDDSRYWSGKTALEIDTTVKAFNEYVKLNGLKTTWHISYAPGVDSDMVNRKLGFVYAKPYDWVEGETIHIPKTVDALRELGIDFIVTNR